AARRISARVGSDDTGGEAEPGKVLFQAREPGFRAVKRRHIGAMRGEPEGLAAGRRAKIEHLAARDIAEKPGRQGGGGILYPPGTLRETGQGFDAAAGSKAQGSRGQDPR